MKIVNTLILALVICLSASVVSRANGTHPAWGYSPNPVPKGYGTSAWGLSPELSYGSITFSAPYPDPSLLTDMEKYIIAGTSRSSLGGGLLPWRTVIFNAVNSIYMNTGSVPSELNADVLKAIMDVEKAKANRSLDQFKSPITGGFPRLDASSFSPGQVFVHLLTQDEKVHFAGIFPEYQDLWFDGVVRDPCTDETIRSQVIGGVFYLRFYGENDTVYEGIDYIYAPVQ